MPIITCLPDRKEIDVRDGDTILEATLRANLAHAHACGGHARCSTCRVRVRSDRRVRPCRSGTYSRPRFARCPRVRSVPVRLRPARRTTDAPARSRVRAASLAHPRIRSSRLCMAGRRAGSSAWGQPCKGRVSARSCRVPNSESMFGLPIHPPTSPSNHVDRMTWLPPPLLPRAVVALIRPTLDPMETLRRNLIGAALVSLVTGTPWPAAAQIQYLASALPEYRWLGIDRRLNGGQGLSEATPSSTDMASWRPSSRATSGSRRHQTCPRRCA